MDVSSAHSAFAALGQETRLQLFRHLVKAGQDGIPQGQLAARIGAVQNTASAHLKVLAQAGLVKTERDGRTIRYVADMNGLGRLLTFLMEDCCAGEPELCRPVIAAVTCHC